MKIKLITLLALLVCIFTLSSCDTTYNQIEYDNLSNAANYRKFDVKFSCVKVLNSTSQTTYYNNEILELVVTFLSLDELNLFQTTKLESVSNLDSYPITFISFKDNTNILLNNNFFNEVKEGDTITIWVNMYRGIDAIYNFLGSVQFNNKTYLSLEDGLNGVKKYMDDNRSPWFQ